MTPHDLAMEEVTLAIRRLTDAMTANDSFLIAQECREGRRVYNGSLKLYPTLQLRAAERDSLLRQIGLLGSELERCERLLGPPAAVDA